MLTTSRGDNDGTGSVCGRWVAPTGAASTTSNAAIRMSWFMVLTPKGPGHPDVARCLNNLLRLDNAQGKYPEAEPLHQRSLAIREKALGPEHPDVARSLERYAALLRQIARADEAERMETRAKAIHAASQELAASDIVKIIVTYHENELKFKRDYLGKTLIATMFFDNAGGVSGVSAFETDRSY